MILKGFEIVEKNGDYSFSSIAELPKCWGHIPLVSFFIEDRKPLKVVKLFFFDKYKKLWPVFHVIMKISKENISANEMEKVKYNIIRFSSNDLLATCRCCKYFGA